MSRARARIRRKSLWWLGALLGFVLLLLLLVLVPQPRSSQAESPDDEVWFVVSLSPDDYRPAYNAFCTMDGAPYTDPILGYVELLYWGDGSEEDWGIVSLAFPITVYRSGRAYSDHSDRPSKYEPDLYPPGELTSIFEGRFDEATNELTGMCEQTWGASGDPDRHISYVGRMEDLTVADDGTFEGVMNFAVSVDWQDEYDNDGELHDYRDTADFVAHVQGSGSGATTTSEVGGATSTTANGETSITAGTTTTAEAGGMSPTTTLGVARGTGGEGGAGKVPGPGSWKDWLEGLAAAGALTSAIGLVSTFGGSVAPGAFGAPTDDPWGPQPPNIEGGTVDPFSGRGVPPEEPSDDVWIQTILNIGDDIGSVPGYLWDNGKWVCKGVANPDNWVDAVDKTMDGLDRLGKAAQPKAQALLDYLDSVADHPARLLDDLDKADKAWDQAKWDAAKWSVDKLDALGKAIVDDPVGTLKAILGADLWEKAMDHRLPLVERFGYSALATLNTIGLIEGLSGLGKWLGGKGAKAAAKGLADDAVRTAAGEEGAVGAAKAAGKTDELAKVSAAEQAQKPSGLSGLSDAAKAEQNEAWKAAQEKAASKVDEFNEARKAANSQDKIDKLLEVRKDPLAVQDLNSRQPGLIKGFNKELGKLQGKSLEDAKRRLAKELGVGPDSVQIVKATNPSATAKTGLDTDFTFRVVKANHTLVPDPANPSKFKWVRQKGAVTTDVPSSLAQSTYDEAFYQNAGSPAGTTPAELGRDMRNVAVERISPESYGDPSDLKAVMKGQAPSDPERVAETMAHKSQQHFAAEKALTGEGRLDDAMTERMMGTRETVKSFKNQIEQRVKSIKQSPGGAANLAPVQGQVDELRGPMRQADKMLKSGASPLEVDAYLKTATGKTAETINQEIVDLYLKLCKP